MLLDPTPVNGTPTTEPELDWAFKTGTLAELLSPLREADPSAWLGKSSFISLIKSEGISMVLANWAFTDLGSKTPYILAD